MGEQARGDISSEMSPVFFFVAEMLNIESWKPKPPKKALGGETPRATEEGRTQITDIKRKKPPSNPRKPVFKHFHIERKTSRFLRLSCFARMLNFPNKKYELGERIS